ncbi:MAG: hypothetical protein PVH31_04435 [Ectothiorhodospiraceae bacterium]|jgi:hypothetical protein
MRSPVSLTAAILAALSVASADASAAFPPDQTYCRNGKIIERELGADGYRVVVAGGYRVTEGQPVKVQIWEGDERDWVITEASFAHNRTCIVRSGVKLHMLDAIRRPSPSRSERGRD